MWSRRPDQPALRAAFDQRVVSGLIATCDMVRIELLASARNPDELDALNDDVDALGQCAITEQEWQRALWVYRSLADQGGAHQRSVKHADLLVAAAAEAAGVGLVHYDEDFDRIAAITGQPTRWLAPRGSLG